MPLHALHAEARERNKQMGRPKQKKASDTFQKASTRLKEEVKNVQFTFDVDSGSWVPAPGWKISYGYLVMEEEEWLFQTQIHTLSVAIFAAGRNFVLMMNAFVIYYRRKNNE